MGLRDALRGLHQIDWKCLYHAYGPARDVPGQLKALASRWEWRRRRAMYALWGNIWHQGSVYGATQFAVPFLIRLAGDPKVKDREEILELLFHIAFGDSFLAVHQNLRIVGSWLREMPDFETRLSLEEEWVRSSYEAVADGWEVYLRLLDDPETAVRSRALHLLVVCQEQADIITENLTSRLEHEKDQLTRAGIIYTIGTLGGKDQRQLLESEMTSESAVVRLAAALCSAFHGPRPMVSKTTDVLIHALEHPDELTMYKKLPFAVDLYGDVAAALCHTEHGETTGIVELLLTALEDQRASSLSVVPPLLKLSFHESKESPLESDLSELQRNVVLTVARLAWTKHRDDMWSIMPNFAQALEEYGLKELGQRMVGYPGDSALFQ